MLLVLVSFICFPRFLFCFSNFRFCFALFPAISAISPGMFLFCFEYLFPAVFALPPPVSAVSETFNYLEVWKVAYSFNFIYSVDLEESSGLYITLTLVSEDSYVITISLWLCAVALGIFVRWLHFTFQISFSTFQYFV